ncbi:MAG: AAA family ATPase [Cyclobacteriaceae bacterium]|nr:AAA family ATPase [Cyclobacteriaceae bacterium]
MIISIVNHKGGTGKTTTTVNLGSALAKEGCKVLLIDFDAQGNLSYSLGLTEFKNSIAHVLLGECTLTQATYASENLFLIPTNHSLADVEISIANSTDRFGYLKDVLSTELEYDYVLIDCPPSLSLLSANALMASHAVIIPMQMEVLAVKGLEMMLETIAKVKSTLNPSLEILGVLPVMADVRKNLYREIVEYVKENFQVPIFNSSIRACVKAAEAPSFGKSVLEYAPLSTAATDYTAFAQEVIHCTQLVNPN